METDYQISSYFLCALFILSCFTYTGTYKFNYFGFSGLAGLRNYLATDRRSNNGELGYFKKGAKNITASEYFATQRYMPELSAGKKLIRGHTHWIQSVYSLDYDGEPEQFSSKRRKLTAGLDDLSTVFARAKSGSLRQEVAFIDDFVQPGKTLPHESNPSRVERNQMSRSVGEGLVLFLLTINDM